MNNKNSSFQSHFGHSSERTFSSLTHTLVFCLIPSNNENIERNDYVTICNEDAFLAVDDFGIAMGPTEKANEDFLPEESSCLNNEIHSSITKGGLFEIKFVEPHHGGASERLRAGQDRESLKYRPCYICPNIKKIFPREGTSRRRRCNYSDSESYINDQSGYVIINYKLVRQCLKYTSPGEKCEVLDAIRLRIKSSQIAIKTIQDIVEFDLFGVQCECRSKPLLGQLLWPITIATPHQLQTSTARLLNALVSYQIGRDYFKRRSIVKLLTWGEVGRDNIDPTMADHLIGVMMKLSNDRFQRSDMIKNGLLKWLLEHMLDVEYAASRYHIECATKLMRNLLRAENMGDLSSTDIQKLILVLGRYLDIEDKAARQNICDCILAFCRKKEIVESAKQMNFARIIEEYIQKTLYPKEKTQLQEVCKLLNGSGTSKSFKNLKFYSKSIHEPYLDEELECDDSSEIDYFPGESLLREKFSGNKKLLSSLQLEKHGSNKTDCIDDDPSKYGTLKSRIFVEPLNTFEEKNEENRIYPIFNNHVDKRQACTHIGESQPKKRQHYIPPNLRTSGLLRQGEIQETNVLSSGVPSRQERLIKTVLIPSEHSAIPLESAAKSKARKHHIALSTISNDKSAIKWSNFANEIVQSFANTLSDSTNTLQRDILHYSTNQQNQLCKLPDDLNGVEEMIRTVVYSQLDLPQDKIKDVTARQTIDGGLLAGPIDNDHRSIDDLLKVDRPLNDEVSIETLKDELIAIIIELSKRSTEKLEIDVDKRFASTKKSSKSLERFQHKEILRRSSVGSASKLEEKDLTTKSVDILKDNVIAIVTEMSIISNDNTMSIGRNSGECRREFYVKSLKDEAIAIVIELSVRQGQKPKMMADTIDLPNITQILQKKSVDTLKNDAISLVNKLARGMITKKQINTTAKQTKLVTAEVTAKDNMLGSSKTAITKRLSDSIISKSKMKGDGVTFPARSVECLQHNAVAAISKSITQMKSSEDTSRKKRDYPLTSSMQEIKDLSGSSRKDDAVAKRFSDSKSKVKGIGGTLAVTQDELLKDGAVATTKISNKPIKPTEQDVICKKRDYPLTTMRESKDDLSASSRKDDAITKRMFVEFLEDGAVVTSAKSNKRIESTEEDISDKNRDYPVTISLQKTKEILPELSGKDDAITTRFSDSLIDKSKVKQVGETLPARSLKLVEDGAAATTTTSIKQVKSAEGNVIGKNSDYTLTLTTSMRETKADLSASSTKDDAITNRLLDSLVRKTIVKGIGSPLPARTIELLEDGAVAPTIKSMKRLKSTEKDIGKNRNYPLTTSMEETKEKSSERSRKDDDITKYFSDSLIRNSEAKGVGGMLPTKSVELLKDGVVATTAKENISGKSRDDQYGKCVYWSKTDRESSTSLKDILKSGQISRYSSDSSIYRSKDCMEHERGYILRARASEPCQKCKTVASLSGYPDFVRALNNNLSSLIKDQQRLVRRNSDECIVVTFINKSIESRHTNQSRHPTQSQRMRSRRLDVVVKNETVEPQDASKNTKNENIEPLNDSKNSKNNFQKLYDKQIDSGGTDQHLPLSLIEKRTSLNTVQQVSSKDENKKTFVEVIVNQYVSSELMQMNNTTTEKELASSNLHTISSGKVKDESISKRKSGHLPNSSKSRIVNTKSDPALTLGKTFVSDGDLIEKMEDTFPITSAGKLAINDEKVSPELKRLGGSYQHKNVDDKSKTFDTIQASDARLKKEFSSPTSKQRIGSSASDTHLSHKLEAIKNKRSDQPITTRKFEETLPRKETLDVKHLEENSKAEALKGKQSMSRPVDALKRQSFKRKSENYNQTRANDSQSKKETAVGVENAVLLARSNELLNDREFVRSISEDLSAAYKDRNVNSVKKRQINSVTAKDENSISRTTNALKENTIEKSHKIKANDEHLTSAIDSKEKAEASVNLLLFPRSNELVNRKKVDRAKSEDLQEVPPQKIMSSTGSDTNVLHKSRKSTEFQVIENSKNILRASNLIVGGASNSKEKVAAGAGSGLLFARSMEVNDNADDRPKSKFSSPSSEQRIGCSASDTQSSHVLEVIKNKRSEELNTMSSTKKLEGTLQRNDSLDVKQLEENSISSATKGKQLISSSVDAIKDKTFEEETGKCFQILANNSNSKKETAAGVDNAVLLARSIELENRKTVDRAKRADLQKNIQERIRSSTGSDANVSHESGKSSEFQVIKNSKNILQPCDLIVGGATNSKEEVAGGAISGLLFARSMEVNDNAAATPKSKVSSSSSKQRIGSSASDTHSSHELEVIKNKRSEQLITMSSTKKLAGTLQRNDSLDVKQLEENSTTSETKGKQFISSSVDAIKDKTFEEETGKCFQILANDSNSRKETAAGVDNAVLLARSIELENRKTVDRAKSADLQELSKDVIVSSTKSDSNVSHESRKSNELQVIKNSKNILLPSDLLVGGATNSKEEVAGGARSGLLFARSMEVNDNSAAIPKSKVSSSFSEQRIGSYDINSKKDTAVGVENATLLARSVELENRKQVDGAQGSDLQEVIQERIKSSTGSDANVSHESGKSSEIEVIKNSKNILRPSDLIVGGATNSKKEVAGGARSGLLLARSIEVNDNAAATPKSKVSSSSSKQRIGSYDINSKTETAVGVENATLLARSVELENRKQVDGAQGSDLQEVIQERIKSSTGSDANVSHESGKSSEIKVIKNSKNILRPSDLIVAGATNSKEEVAGGARSGLLLARSMEVNDYADARPKSKFSSPSSKQIIGSSASDAHSTHELEVLKNKRLEQLITMSSPKKSEETSQSKDFFDVKQLKENSSATETKGKQLRSWSVDAIKDKMFEEETGKCYQILVNDSNSHKETAVDVDIAVLLARSIEYENHKTVDRAKSPDLQETSKDIIVSSTRSDSNVSHESGKSNELQVIKNSKNIILPSDLIVGGATNSKKEVAGGAVSGLLFARSMEVNDNAAATPKSKVSSSFSIQRIESYDINSKKETAVGVENATLLARSVELENRKTADGAQGVNLQEVIQEKIRSSTGSDANVSDESRKSSEFKVIKSSKNILLPSDVIVGGATNSKKEVAGGAISGLLFARSMEVNDNAAATPKSKVSSSFSIQRIESYDINSKKETAVGVENATLLARSVELENRKTIDGAQGVNLQEVIQEKIRSSTGSDANVSHESRKSSEFQVIKTSKNILLPSDLIVGGATNSKEGVADGALSGLLLARSMEVNDYADARPKSKFLSPSSTQRIRSSASDAHSTHELEVLKNKRLEQLITMSSTKKSEGTSQSKDFFDVKQLKENSSATETKGKQLRSWSVDAIKDKTFEEETGKSYQILVNDNSKTETAVGVENAVLLARSIELENSKTVDGARSADLQKGIQERIRSSTGSDANFSHESRKSNNLQVIKNSKIEGDFPITRKLGETVKLNQMENTVATPAQHILPAARAKSDLLFARSIEVNDNADGRPKIIIPSPSSKQRMKKRRSEQLTIIVSAKEIEETARIVKSDVLLEEKRIEENSVEQSKNQEADVAKSDHFLYFRSMRNINESNKPLQSIKIDGGKIDRSITLEPKQMVEISSVVGNEDYELTSRVEDEFKTKVIGEKQIELYDQLQSSSQPLTGIRLLPRSIAELVNSKEILGSKSEDKSDIEKSVAADHQDEESVSRTMDALQGKTLEKGNQVQTSDENTTLADDSKEEAAVSVRTTVLLPRSVELVNRKTIDRAKIEHLSEVPLKRLMSPTGSDKNFSLEPEKSTNFQTIENTKIEQASPIISIRKLDERVCFEETNESFKLKGIKKTAAALAQHILHASNLILTGASSSEEEAAVKGSLLFARSIEVNDNADARVNKEFSSLSIEQTIGGSVSDIHSTHELEVIKMKRADQPITMSSSRKFEQTLQGKYSLNVKQLEGNSTTSETKRNQLISRSVDAIKDKAFEEETEKCYQILENNSNSKKETAAGVDNAVLLARSIELENRKTVDRAKSADLQEVSKDIIVSSTKSDSNVSHESGKSNELQAIKNAKNILLPSDLLVGGATNSKEEVAGGAIRDLLSPRSMEVNDNATATPKSKVSSSSSKQRIGSYDINSKTETAVGVENDTLLARSVEYENCKTVDGAQGADLQEVIQERIRSSTGSDANVSHESRISSEFQVIKNSENILLTSDLIVGGATNLKKEVAGVAISGLLLARSMEVNDNAAATPKSKVSSSSSKQRIGSYDTNSKKETAVGVENATLLARSIELENRKIVDRAKSADLQEVPKDIIVSSTRSDSNVSHDTGKSNELQVIKNSKNIILPSDLIVGGATNSKEEVAGGAISGLLFARSMEVNDNAAATPKSKVSSSSSKQRIGSYDINSKKETAVGLENATLLARSVEYENRKTVDRAKSADLQETSKDIIVSPTRSDSNVSQESRKSSEFKVIKNSKNILRPSDLIVGGATNSKEEVAGGAISGLLFARSMEVNDNAAATPKSKVSSSSSKQRIGSYDINSKKETAVGVENATLLARSVEYENRKTVYRAKSADLQETSKDIIVSPTRSDSNVSQESGKSNELQVIKNSKNILRPSDLIVGGATNSKEEVAGGEISGLLFTRSMEVNDNAAATPKSKVSSFSSKQRIGSYDINLKKKTAVGVENATLLARSVEYENRKTVDRAKNADLQETSKDIIVSPTRSDSNVSQESRKSSEFKVIKNSKNILRPSDLIVGGATNSKEEVAGGAISGLLFARSKEVNDNAAATPKSKVSSSSSKQRIGSYDINLKKKTAFGVENATLLARSVELENRKTVDRAKSADLQETSKDIIVSPTRSDSNVSQDSRKSSEFKVIKNSKNILRPSDLIVGGATNSKEEVAGGAISGLLFARSMEVNDNAAATPKSKVSSPSSKQRIGSYDINSKTETAVGVENATLLARSVELENRKTVDRAKSADLQEVIQERIRSSTGSDANVSHESRKSHNLQVIKNSKIGGDFPITRKLGETVKLNQMENIVATPAQNILPAARAKSDLLFARSIEVNDNADGRPKINISSHSSKQRMKKRRSEQLSIIVSAKETARIVKSDVLLEEKRIEENSVEQSKNQEADVAKSDHFLYFRSMRNINESNKPLQSIEIDGVKIDRSITLEPKQMVESSSVVGNEDYELTSRVEDEFKTKVIGEKQIELYDQLQSSSQPLTGIRLLPRSIAELVNSKEILGSKSEDKSDIEKSVAADHHDKESVSRTTDVLQGKTLEKGNQVQTSDENTTSAYDSKEEGAYDSKEEGADDSKEEGAVSVRTAVLLPRSVELVNRKTIDQIKILKIKEVVRTRGDQNSSASLAKKSKKGSFGAKKTISKEIQAGRLRKSKELTKYVPSDHSVASKLTLKLTFSSSIKEQELVRVAMPSKEQLSNVAKSNKNLNKLTRSLTFSELAKVKATSKRSDTASNKVETSTETINGSNFANGGVKNDITTSVEMVANKIIPTSSNNIGSAKMGQPKAAAEVKGYEKLENEKVSNRSSVVEAPINKSIKSNFESNTSISSQLVISSKDELIARQRSYHQLSATTTNELYDHDVLPKLSKKTSTSSGHFGDKIGRKSLKKSAKKDASCEKVVSTSPTTKKGERNLVSSANSQNARSAVGVRNALSSNFLENKEIKTIPHAYSEHHLHARSIEIKDKIIPNSSSMSKATRKSFGEVISDGKASSKQIHKTTKVNQLGSKQSTAKAAILKEKIESISNLGSGNGSQLSSTNISKIKITDSERNVSLHHSDDRAGSCLLLTARSGEITVDTLAQLKGEQNVLQTKSDGSDVRRLRERLNNDLFDKTMKDDSETDSLKMSHTLHARSFEIIKDKPIDGPKRNLGAITKCSKYVANDIESNKLADMLENQGAARQGSVKKNPIIVDGVKYDSNLSRSSIISSEEILLEERNLSSGNAQCKQILTVESSEATFSQQLSHEADIRPSNVQSRERHELKLVNSTSRLKLLNNEKIINILYEKVLKKLLTENQNCAPNCNSPCGGLDPKERPS